MSLEPLQYHTPPSAGRTFLRRVWQGTVVGGSHFIGACTCWLIMTATGLVVTSIVAGGYMVSQFLSLGEADGPPPVAIPLVAAILAIVGIILSITIATLLTAIVGAVGITADALRRPLGLPGVLIPGFVAVASGLIWAIKCLVTGMSWWLLVRHSILASGLITSVFCVYWLPMMFSEAIVKLATGSASMLVHRLPPRWRAKFSVESQARMLE